MANNLFRTPINWVINTVWNDGIKAAFDSVADAVGSDARLGSIPTIPRFGSSSGSRGNVPGYAKGGLAPEGWAIVGEEGPELVNFSNPGRVYTADETRSMLSGGAEGVMPMGGGLLSPWQRLAVEFGMTDAGQAIGERLVEGWDWVRGKLADGVEWLMEPILNGLDGFASQYGLMGDLGSSLVRWGVNSVVDWATGKDEEDVGGYYGGEFEANPGGYNRPMAGPITSEAGLRPYVGRYGNMHYGVDIGGPIGTAVRAMFSGVIKSISGAGNNQTLIMNHGRYDTAYLHMSDITRAIGESVRGGDVVARSGTAGSGPHGHFEYHPGGWYNPSIGIINSLISDSPANPLVRDEGGIVPPGRNVIDNWTGEPEYIFDRQKFDNLNRMAASSSEHGPGLVVNQYGLDGDNARGNVNEFMRAKRRMDRGGKFAGVSA